MRNFKGLFVSGVFSAAVFGGVTAPAFADISANVGFASEYYFRGILQNDSSGSAGIDFDSNGFYVGTWGADVGDGLEVDLYGGYKLELDGGFSVGIGVTGYYYTGEFDDTYEEINLYAGWGPISVEYSIGTYDNFEGRAIPGSMQLSEEQDYDFFKVKVEYNGFHGAIGTFGDDFDGEYIDLGYGTDIGGFDAGIALILNSDELSDQRNSNGDATEGEALIFTLGKVLDL